MSYTIEDSNLVVKKPNIGWPDLRPLQSLRWQIDLTESAISDTPTYTSIQIFRTTDNADVTSDFSVSGSGSQDGKVIVTETATVPANAKSLEYYSVIWYDDDGLSESVIIPFRVLNG